MALSDIFVLPCIITKNGDRDGIPNVLLESMSVGTPVISTNISAIPELIEDKITGILVPEKNEIAIANAILTLYKDSNLYKNITENARKKIKKVFDIEKTIGRLEILFNTYICETN